MSLETEFELTLPVQRQLEAQNEADIDAFMACWAENCACYDFPSHLVARGAAAVREAHLPMFSEPNLFGHLIKRMTVGNLVIDQQVVTRTFAEGPGELDMVAIYEVAQERIQTAWYHRGERRLHRAPGGAGLQRAGGGLRRAA